MIEQWRNVVGYENTYAVSSLGRVRNLTKKSSSRDSFKILSPHTTKLGRVRVGLHRAGTRAQFLVHRLVAEAFIGPCPKGKEINHINGIPSDNRPENLEYITHLENMRHASLIGKFGSNSRVMTAEQEDVLFVWLLIRRMARSRHARSENKKRPDYLV